MLSLEFLPNSVRPDLMTSAASLLPVIFFVVMEVTVLFLLFVMMRWLLFCLACRSLDCLMNAERSA